MKRFVIGCLIALVVAPAALASVSADRAQLQNFVCKRAVQPAARALEVTAVMRPVPETLHMELRVVLLRRGHDHGAFTSVSGHDLGKWISPKNPTLGQRPGDVWRLVKQVVDLPAATYRFVFTFRWIGAHGRTLGTTTRDSALCVQPELRPDLKVTKIAIRPVAGVPKDDTYTATIRNGGKSAAGAFDVQLSVGSAIVGNKMTGPLGPHRGTQVAFQAAACSPGARVTVVADPNDQVDDFNRANNTLTVSCPGTAAAVHGSSQAGR